jgi:hypothetical protein
MSAKVKKKNKSRLSQEYLDSLIEKKEANQEEIQDQAEPLPLKSQPENQEKIRTILFSKEDYDTLAPVKHIKEFCKFVQDSVCKYEANQLRQKEIETQNQDILHFVEMEDLETKKGKEKLYNLLSEMRKERRTIKNENELLKPIYEYFHGTNMLDRLRQLQGDCNSVKEIIEHRGYSVRTSVLNEFLMEEEG